MTRATAEVELLSTGQAAREIGIEGWQLVRMYVRGLVEEPHRFGRYRAVRRADLDKLRAAAVRAGYLQQVGG
jgi:hypothetical protein